MSFCRITGRARSLPKPNFFPIIPPISPADARKLCRITGRRMDDHNFVPLLEFGKQPECCKCSITANSADKLTRDKNHDTRSDYKYVTPILKKEAMDKCDQRAFEDLQKVLKTLCKNIPENEGSRMYVYLLSPALCGLIIPAEVEMAVRLGDLESVSVSKSCDKAIFKIRGRPTLCIPLKEVNVKIDSKDVFFDGLGQTNETLVRQKKILEDKKRKTLANKKIFEDLEKQAEEEFIKDSERVKGKIRIFGGGKSQKAKQYRQKLADFREMFLPESNMALYGEDWASRLNVSISGLDWEDIGRVKQPEVDSPLPKRFKVALEEKETAALANVKRHKNVHVPQGASLEFVPALEGVSVKEFQPSEELKQFVMFSKRSSSLTSDYASHSSLQSMFATGKEDALRILPTLEEFLKAGANFNGAKSRPKEVKIGCIFENGDGLKFCEEESSCPLESNIVAGAIVKIPPFEEKDVNQIFRFIPGHMIGNDFVPGQKLAAVNGEFIPAACVRSNEGVQFLPGLFAPCSDGNSQDSFIAGQFVECGKELKFVRGQIAHTTKGPKFVEGETVWTADGLKFVVGVKVEDKFVCGTMIDAGGERAQFMQGQLIGFSPENLYFIPGNLVLDGDGKPNFVPGQTIGKKFVAGQTVPAGKTGFTFVHGEVYVNGKSQIQFLPGMDIEGVFLPGLQSDNGFVEGKLISAKSKPVFVPGKTSVFDQSSNRFTKATSDKELSLHNSPDTCKVIDGSTMSVVFKKTKPKNGVMITTKTGSHRFVPDGQEIPSSMEDGERVFGRMECGVDGPKFVPGKIMVINGVKTFIPGKTFKEGDGAEVFVPGKMISGKNGPRFVPGQVIETEDGNEQFIPGQIMETKDGKKFVPGQIIDTKSGQAFIPGQVIQTDGGLKFVPGEIVIMSNGSALFVPGQVIDSPTGARFVPGQVVETEEGPRLLPPDLKGDGDLEYCVQGFDINQEESRLILGSSPTAADVPDMLGGIGDAMIGAEAIKALADGFNSRKANVIAVMGEGDDLAKILEDEMLDSCDNQSTRQTIKAIFLAVFVELCQKIDEIIAAVQPFMDSYLTKNIDSTVLSDMKLYPALETLRKFCQEKNIGEPVEYEILNLIAGIITCSVPGALKECHAQEDMTNEKFKSVLLSSIGDSIKGILEEEGIDSRGLFEDIKDVVKLAKDMGFDENESFFSKVAALTESRANTVFMTSLLNKLKHGAAQGLNHNFDMNHLLMQLINVLSPRLHLQNGFRQMAATSPDFIHEVLEFLKTHDNDALSGYSAIDILHSAISKATQNKCKSQLEDVMHKVERDTCILEKDQDLRSMLEQAIGLARYLKKDQVVELLFELLGDPIRMEAIRDDPIIREVLDRIMLMQKLASKDLKKKQKLEKLQRYTSDDEDDSTLKELIHQCEALIKEPVARKKAKVQVPHQDAPDGLKKSKSMIKKSKSMIMSAKDISMNAFMAIKSKADDEQSENWLQNFLTQSLVEDIPWECSKALIILKQGYQAILPREASRSILMGEASYTLIDDNGVEFFLSPKDKLKRKENGHGDNEPKTIAKSELTEKKEPSAKVGKLIYCYIKFLVITFFFRKMETRITA